MHITKTAPAAEPEPLSPEIIFNIAILAALDIIIYYKYNIMSERIKTAGIIKYYKRLKKSNPLIDILLFVITVIVIGVLVYLWRQQNKKDSPSNDVGPGTVAGPGVEYDLDKYLTEIASYRSRYENDKSDINKQLLENQINQCISKYGEYACRGGEEVQRRKIASEIAELDRELDEEIEQLRSQKETAQRNKDDLQLKLIEKQRETAKENKRLKDEKAKLQALKDAEAKKAREDPKYNYEILEDQHYGICKTAMGVAPTLRDKGCMVPQVKYPQNNNFDHAGWPVENVTTEDECARLCNRSILRYNLEKCKGYSYKFAQHPIKRERENGERGSCYLSWHGTTSPKSDWKDKDFWITRKKI